MQMFVDFGQLIHNQFQDKDGQKLPHDLMSGAYRVRNLTDCTAQFHTDATRTFTDEWGVYTQFTSAGCGVNTTDFWQWSL